MEIRNAAGDVDLTDATLIVGMLPRTSQPLAQRRPTPRRTDRCSNWPSSKGRRGRC